MRMSASPSLVPVPGSGAPGRPPQPMTHTERLAYMHRLRKEGKTFREIGRRVGRTRQWVQQQLLREARRFQTFFLLAEEFHAPIEVLDDDWLMAVIEPDSVSGSTI